MELNFSLGPSLVEEPATDGPAVENVLIIGGGVAGFTAAMYAGRAALRPLLLVGNALGGQAASTEMMENYPGFPEGVAGPELIERVQKQATQFGARVEYDEALEVDFSVRPFVVKTYGKTYQAHSVIVATGARSRRLGVPGESKFLGRGISFCATCDGFFYRGKRVAVVGGGNSAVEEGMYLARLAERVYVIHRRDELRAEKVLQERALQNPKMEFIWDTVVEEIVGDEHVEKIVLRNRKTDERSDLDIDGVFEYVGMLPNTDLFKGKLEMDEHGYLVTDRRQETSVPGVFAAGDVQSPYSRQVVIAAGTAAAAAIEAERYLASME
jgi:thioredoxin reductase (NADPH)